MDQVHSAKHADPKTPYYLRFNEEFRGPVIPFGAEVTYKPSSDKDIARLHKFGSKVLSGVFLGYVQRAGGGWTGDLLVADWENMESAETAYEVYEWRVKAEEVFVEKPVGDFIFPIADGSLRQPGVREEERARSRARRVAGPRCC